VEDISQVPTVVVPVVIVIVVPIVGVVVVIPVVGVVVIVPIVSSIVVPVVVIVVAEVGLTTGVGLDGVSVEVVEINGEDIELPEVGVEDEWDVGQPHEEHPGVVESLPCSEANDSLGWGEDELVLVSISTIWSGGGVGSSVGLDSKGSNALLLVSVGEDSSDILT